MHKDSSRVMQGADSTQRSPIFNYSLGMIANEALQRNCKIAGRGPISCADFRSASMPVRAHKRSLDFYLFSSILCRIYAGLSWVRMFFVVPCHLCYVPVQTKCCTVLGSRTFVTCHICRISYFQICPSLRRSVRSVIGCVCVTEKR